MRGEAPAGKCQNFPCEEYSLTAPETIAGKDNAKMLLLLNATTSTHGSYLLFTCGYRIRPEAQVGMQLMHKLLVRA